MERMKRRLICFVLTASVLCSSNAGIYAFAAEGSADQIIAEEYGDTAVPEENSVGWHEVSDSAARENGGENTDISEAEEQYEEPDTFGEGSGTDEHEQIEDSLSAENTDQPAQADADPESMGDDTDGEDTNLYQNESGNEIEEPVADDSVFRGRVSSTIEGQEAIPEDNSGKSSDDLFAEYVEECFGEQVSKDPFSEGKLLRSAAASLSGIDRAIYDNIAACLPATAAGERASTIFEIAVDKLGLGQTFWTAEELGVASVFVVDENGDIVTDESGEGSISEEALTAMQEKVDYDLTKIISALLADHPYQLYWYEKTLETGSTDYEVFAFYDETAEDYKIGIIGSISISFPVAEEYSAGKYMVDTSIGQAVQASVANANAIVEQYAGAADYEKLCSYKDEICELVSYNYEAAEGGVSYGNPWQMIWVFDDDPFTNVVCEGYAKAFKYLCDQTDFDGDISCITVTGTMMGGTGEGAHMWNIVNMEDGNNYLVDVTNCDEGTIGAPEMLCLVGFTRGDLSEGYIFDCSGQEITYVYDDNTLSIYGEKDLLVCEAENSLPEGIIAQGKWLDSITWALSDQGVMTVSGSGAMLFATRGVWEEYSDKIVEVFIEEGITTVSGFDHCENLKRVYLPDSVETIGKFAFWKCTSLELISIPESVEYIEEFAFDGCHSLKEIRFSGSEIAGEAFRDCTNLERITFGNELVSIGDFCFISCKSLNNVVLPESLTRLGVSAFYGCTSLESIVIPSSLSEIKIDTFFETGLISVEIPEGVQHLGDRAFFRCSKLEEIRLPDSMRTIGDLCFSQCYSLQSISLNDGLLALGMQALYGCPISTLYIPSTLTELGKEFNLGNVELSEISVSENNSVYTSLDNIIYNKSFEKIVFAPPGLKGDITIPGTVKSLDENAFAFSGISKVSITNGVESISDGCFRGCHALHDVILPESITSIGKDAFAGCQSLTSIHLPDNLKEIGNTAFIYSGLTSIFIPASVESIGEGAFSEALGLFAFAVDDNNEWYCAIDGVIYNKNVSSLVAFPYTRKGEFTIPDTILNIDNRAFEGACISSVIIPGSIQRIADKAFSGCSLSRITINEGVKSIGAFAFAYCKNLMQIDLPSSLNHIEAYAFSGCDSLESIILNDKMIIDEGVFHNCVKLSNLILKGELEHVGSLAFYETAFYNDESNWTDNVLYLGNCIIQAKQEYEGEYVFPSSNNIVADEAFLFCENLTSIIIPEGVTSISRRCFEGCNSLSKIVLPNSLQVLEDYAFCFSNSKNDYFTPVQDIIIPPNIKYLGKSVFAQLGFVNIYFTGDAPEFNDEFLSSTDTRSVYMHYPADNKTWNNVITNCYGNVDGILPWVPYEGKVHSHSYTEIVIKQASCDQEGTTKYICDSCGDEVFVKTPSKGHTWNKEFTVVKEAGCKNAGIKKYVCNDCEAEVHVEIPPKGHSWSNDYTIDKAPSYIEEGSKSIHCSVCDAIKENSGVSIPKLLNPLGKTTRGDMFNLANNVKVTWKEVPRAKYYKVYREGVTDKKETRTEPVIVTTGLVGWDSQPGLTNGHAYRYKIVASLTGKGDSSGDSPFYYSKVMYRLKTVVIRSVKNTAPGKVTVKYDKTTSGDSYVLQYCEREDMVGAKTKVVLGANNTSYVIGGLKKGKTYYISIRVRKKVNGIDYYTTFGVPKKVKVEK